MVESFKIASKDKSKYLFRPLLILCCIGFVICFVIILYKKTNLILGLQILFGALVGQSFLYFIPLFLFYNNYLKKDKHVFFNIGTNGESFSYQNKYKVVEFKEKDIQKVILHLSPALYDRRSTGLFWDDYFYSEIITTKGIFKVSCLVIDAIEDYIDKDKIERRKEYFPFMNDKPSKVDLSNPLNRMDKLKNNFKNKSKEELIEILNNKEKYQKDVLRIVEELLQVEKV